VFYFFQIDIGSFN